ncbi:MAG: DedA family protein [Candidatus Stahlbacteria bacterium]|nr:MAG: DedA family protein [Candidatus Stahlbacteria bacterium]
MFEWLSGREPILIYLFLFINSLFESLFPPYPSDAFVLVFAFLAGQGYFSPYLVYVFVIGGATCGIMILYYIGKNKGDVLIQFLTRSFLGKVFPVKMIEKAKKKFAKHGDLIVFLNRFLPGMRAPICFAAGVVKINSKKFFSYSFVSVLIWNLFLVMVGFYVGSTWDEASKFLKNYSIIVTLILIPLLIVFAIIYFRKRKKIQ